jgi:ribonuclease VapC
VIIDSSALIAILAREPERPRFIDAIVDAAQCSVIAPTLLETAIVLRRFGPTAVSVLRDFIRDSHIDIIPFGAEHVTAAQDAFTRFGRGSGHAAKLNFGDCFSYAACAVSGRPLLFKGNDFIHTEILDALQANA